MSRGGSLTITPNAGGGMPASFTLYRDGVAVPTQTAKSKATLEARLFADVDLGASAITVRANNAAGQSADSNVIAYTPTAAGAKVDYLADSAYVQLTLGKVSRLSDRTANASHLLQGTAVNRPTIEQINGRDAVRFDDAVNQSLRCAALASLGSTSPQLTVMIALQWQGTPGTARSFMLILDDGNGPGYYYLDDAVTVGWPSASFGGATAQRATAEVTDGLVWYVARRTNVSTNTAALRRNGNEVASATATLTAMSSSTPALLVGGYPGNLFPLNARVRAVALWSSALSDSQVLDLEAYVCGQATPLPSWSGAPPVMFVSDSTGVGTQGDTGGYRSRGSAAVIAAGLPMTLVGPITDAYGSHRSTGGQVGRNVLLGADLAANPSFPDRGFREHCRTYLSNGGIVVYGHGINDMFGGSFTGATTLATREALRKIQREEAPLSKAIQLGCYRWTNYAPGAAYLAECDAFNAGIGALAASLGDGFVALDVDGAKSDGVHPTDAAYATDAVSIAAEIIYMAGG